jgi:hypothetical protein
MSTARKFEELKAAPEGSTLPEIESVEKATRPLLMNPGVDLDPEEDFNFVPDQETGSKNAADDLRSEFGGFQ